MYGHCETCGKRYGTVDGENFSEPCEHMKEIHLKRTRLMSRYAVTTDVLESSKYYKLIKFEDLAKMKIKDDDEK
jgi:hypothetical protein